ncbi:type II 3-dehydroquinate dehydratase [Vulcanibacillus modesticaldus]|uniref:3-dehydroquinate dehydratase n=1 Tax=Vulcanibacillus modesticaldus TaxID=337097 RepID=A0A1D2YRQ1_9BACI|nr:type II 3-dehydroquinate dehydratase [Vulcanibacillus modesticaldus]OEF95504.1 type II 3-dehydroquinate dehydratase [Vulcanibacillus modesticaldus]
MKKRILVLNGPNLNLLGKREPKIYGTTTLEEVNKQMLQIAEEKNLELTFFQSNHEGELIDHIHDAMGNFDGIIMNPGAFTHYSYAISDAIAAVQIPLIEVHISNIYQRETFRQHSVIAPVSIGQISGLGVFGYIAAIYFFADFYK